MKENRAYGRFQRCGTEQTRLEFGLVAMGFNLYKHRNRLVRAIADEKRTARKREKAAAWRVSMLPP